MSRKSKPPQGKVTGNKRKTRGPPSRRVGPFRLPDLAPELRNHIYAQVLQNKPQAYLTTSNRGKVFLKSAMARVIRQVREESSSLLQVVSSEMIAEVKNFDFAHLGTNLTQRTGGTATSVVPPCSKAA